jgi:hypothetical protein
MFIDLYNGRIEGTNFVVTVNGIDLTVQYEEINGEILVKYNIFTS